MESSNSVLLSVADVATQLNVSPKTLRKLIQNGDIPAYRIGQQVRLSLDEVLRATATKSLNQP